MTDLLAWFLNKCKDDGMDMESVKKQLIDFIKNVEETQEPEPEMADEVCDRCATLNV